DGPRHARRLPGKDVCVGSGQLACGRTCQCSCSSFESSYRQFAAVSYVGKKVAEHGIMGAPAVQEVRGSLYL
ncbi:hypothetical protein H0E87_007663, partial [Populus deltoides]